MAEIPPGEDEAQVIVAVADAAMHMYRAAIDSLPRVDHPKFHNRAQVILSGLRKLQTSLAEAAGRNRSTPSVIVALSEARRRYDEVMTSAAEAPGATLGQRLYVARMRAKLSAQEVANGAGLPADVLDALEAGQQPSQEDEPKLKELLAAIDGISDSTEVTRPQRSVPDIHGWDENAVSGANHHR
jgi:hypothetical protein